MLCPKCGTANPDSSEQCFNCGQLLSESPGAFRDDRPNVPQWGDDLVPDWLSALQVNLPEELRDHVKNTNLMIIFPDQYSDDPMTMTFAEPQPTEQESAYAALRTWAMQRLKK